MAQEGIIGEPGLTRGAWLTCADSEERALVARAQQGDASAIDELYRRYRDRVYTLCLDLCGDPEEAEDLLQETFVNACRGLPKFAGRSTLATWLYRIAVNAVRSSARRRRREPIAGLPLPEPPPFAIDPDPATISGVRAALAGLHPRHRQVLALRYSQSLSYQEIGDSLGWPLARVRATLHRARCAFKKAYLRAQEL